jgi:hypothetical protein
MRRDFKVGTSEFSVAVWHKTPLWTTATVIVVVPKIIQRDKCAVARWLGILFAKKNHRKNNVISELVIFIFFFLVCFAFKFLLWLQKTICKTIMLGKMLMFYFIQAHTIQSIHFWE